MLRSLVLFFMCVGLAGFTGCGGDQDATTVPREERPKELKQPTQGTPPKTVDGEELPEGVEKVD